MNQSINQSNQIKSNKKFSEAPQMSTGSRALTAKSWWPILTVHSLMFLHLRWDGRWDGNVFWGATTQKLCRP